MQVSAHTYPISP